MIEFAPFSAVLVNFQFYRRNKITCFVLDDNVLLQHPLVLTIKGFRLFSLAVLGIQLAELSAFLTYLMS